MARNAGSQDRRDGAVWAEREGYGRYVSGRSLKGALAIEWDHKAQRQQALATIVADAGAAAGAALSHG